MHRREFLRNAFGLAAMAGAVAALARPANALPSLGIPWSRLGSQAARTLGLVSPTPALGMETAAQMAQAVLVVGASAGR